VRRGAALHDLGIIEDGSVLIRDGVIAAVGSTRRIENLKEARDALEIPVNGRLVMPGFVDASLSLSLENVNDPAKRRKVADFYDDSLALLRSCLQHGTVAAEVKATADSGDYHSDISVLRKLAHIGSNPVRMVRTWRIKKSSAGVPPGDLRKTFSLLARRKLIQFIEVSAESEQWLDEEILAAAEEANIGIKLLWYGGSAEELGTVIERVQPRTICCFCHMSREESAVLSASQVLSVFATGKEVFEGPAGMSARQLADDGGALALSSGYDSASAASFSMQMSLSLAVVRLGLTVEQAFIAATINAAHAAGCGDIIGSLEAGKQADVLVMNVPDYREVPRQFGINHVEMAIRQGSVVYNRTRWRPSSN